MCFCDQHSTQNTQSSFPFLNKEVIQHLRDNLQSQLEKRQALKAFQPLDIEFPENVATVVFKNGTIYTMDQNNPKVQAVAVRHKKILKVGTFKDIQPLLHTKTKIIDLQSKTMLPGFIDPHIHMTSTTFTPWLDLGPYANKNTDEIKQKLKQALKTADPNYLLTCHLYDPQITPGELEMNIKTLDELSDKIGIYILQANLHVAHVNSAAYRLLGITKQTKDPPQGRFMRDENGQFTGIAYEKALNQFQRKFPPMTAQKYIKYFSEFLKLAASKGCTSLHDCAIGYIDAKADISLLSHIYNNNPPVRYSGMLVSNKFATWQELKMIPNTTDSDLRIRGMKFWADGSTQLGTAYMRQNYKIQQYKKGHLNWTKQQLLNQIKRVHDLDWQIGIHANGDGAVDLALQIFEEINITNPKPNLRNRIQHSTICHKQQLQKMKKLNLTPSFLIGHIYYYGEVFQKNLGVERAKLMDPLKTAFQCQLRPTIHSDWNCQPIDPLRCIHNAVTRKVRPTGEVITPSQCVSTYQAIQAMTVNAAWQCHLDDIVGSITEGRMADFVILDQDPLKIKPDYIINIKVLQTWMNGRVTYNNWTENLTPSTEQLIQESNKTRSKL